MSQELPSEHKTRMTIHYIDKVHATILETGRSVNKVMTLLYLCAFVVIALCLGGASAEKDLSLVGLKLVISPWLFISGGACLCVLLYVYMVSLAVHETNLRILIYESYESVGYTHKSMLAKHAAPYAIPSIVDVITEPIAISEPNSPRISCMGILLNLVVSLCGMTLLSLSPFAAVALAAYKMTLTFGRVWWIFSSFFVLAFLMIGYFVVGMKMQSMHNTYIKRAKQIVGPNRP